MSTDDYRSRLNTDITSYYIADVTFRYDGKHLEVLGELPNEVKDILDKYELDIIDKLKNVSMVCCNPLQVDLGNYILVGKYQIEDEKTVISGILFERNYITRMELLTLRQMSLESCL